MPAPDASYLEGLFLTFRVRLREILPSPRDVCQRLDRFLGLGLARLAIAGRSAAFDLCEGSLEEVFEMVRGVRLAIDRAKQVPAFLASFPQLLGRGLHKDGDAILLGQESVAQAHGQDIGEVVPGSLVHGKVPHSAQVETEAHSTGTVII